MSSIGRRRFLTGLATAGVVAFARTARALGPGSKFRVGQVIVTGGNWDPRPTAFRKLLSEIELRTSIDVALPSEGKIVQTRLESDRLRAVPFLVLAGDRAFAPPPPREVEALRRFLTYGGFLLVDSAEGRVGGGFDASVRRLVQDLFPAPAAGLVHLPNDHVLYRTFYLIERPVGRTADAPNLEVVLHDKRAVIVYSQNDLAGAWELGGPGRTFAYGCYPGGEAQREMAFRLGVNIAMYALCLDYKSDQVHVPFLLRRRGGKRGP